jgi:hypothetical protein
MRRSLTYYCWSPRSIAPEIMTRMGEKWVFDRRPGKIWPVCRLSQQAVIYPAPHFVGTVHRSFRKLSMMCIIPPNTFSSGVLGHWRKECLKKLIVRAINLKIYITCWTTLRKTRKASNFPSLEPLLVQLPSVRAGSMVQRSVLTSVFVRMHPSQLLLRGAATRPTRRRSGGAVRWGSQPGIVQVREGDSTQLIPLDAERDDEEGARTVRASQMCAV